jgi:hypothetical protein
MDFVHLVDPIHVRLAGTGIAESGRFDGRRSGTSLLRSMRRKHPVSSGESRVASIHGGEMLFELAFSW